MRETETGWALHTSSGAWTRALRLTAVALSVGLVMSAGAARAQDAEEEDQPFEQKVIKQIMTGLGGTNMENTGIDYRERSPLVVPPKIDLPPPDARGPAPVANWPKDPDVQQRRAAAANAKTGRPEEVLEAARPLTPREMAPKRARGASAAVDNSSPGDPNKNIVLSPKQLGYEGGLFKNMFGSNKGETAQFTGEPTRDSLTQPPVGYQTPASGYAYGTGPKETMKNDYNINPMTGKF